MSPNGRAAPLVIPILAITRQQLAACITRRDRRSQLLQLGFEKMVGDDQRLDRRVRVPELILSA